MDTLTIAFGGKYRPLSFQHSDMGALVDMARAAIVGTADDGRLTLWIQNAARVMDRHPTYSATSTEHGGLSVSIRRRAHDPFLDSLTRTFPAYPMADYSLVCN